MSDGRPRNATSDAARAEIFERIRRARGTGAPTQADRAAVEDYLQARARGPIRALGGDPVERFIANATAMQSTAVSVDADADAPRAAADYLARHGLPMRGCVSPAIAGLPWAEAGLELAARGAAPEDAVGITGAFAALAETGTLMLIGGEETPATVSLLPETHIALVRASRVVACMEDAWDLARSAFAELPRSVNFVSGPSRTGDIEQKMVLGVHGPQRVHLIVIRDA